MTSDYNSITDNEIVTYFAALDLKEVLVSMCLPKRATYFAVFDSNGKPEAGFSDGNSFWEGRFSQCNGVLHDALLVNGSVHIHGRYYKAQLTGLLLPDHQVGNHASGIHIRDRQTDTDTDRQILVQTDRYSYRQIYTTQPAGNRVRCPGKTTAACSENCHGNDGD